MSFTLFNLPYLALENVLIQTTLHEKFILSLVSKRIQRLIKACVAREKLQLLVLVNDMFRLFGNEQALKIWTLEKSRLCRNEENFEWKLLGHDSVPVKIEMQYEEETIITYWDDVTKIMNPLIKYLCDVFLSPELRLIVEMHPRLGYRPSAPEDVPKIVKSIEDMNITITFIELRNLVGNNNNLVKKALQEWRHIPELVLRCELTSKFNYFPKTKPFNFELFNACYAKWIKIGHVLKLFMDCKVVYLTGASFTDKALVQLVKKWSNGCKMENFTIGYERDTITEISTQLGNVVSVQKAIIKTGFREFTDGQCFTFSNIYGKPAIVYLDVIRKNLVLQTDFEVIDV